MRTRCTPISSHSPDRTLKWRETPFPFRPPDQNDKRRPDRGRDHPHSRPRAPYRGQPLPRDVPRSRLRCRRQVAFGRDLFPARRGRGLPLASRRRVETWFWHAGAPLLLSLSADGSATEERRLGPSVGAGEAPQIIIPERHWQAARSLGDWTLVSCTDAPGFTFDGFELAPPDWSPGKR